MISNKYVLTMSGMYRISSDNMFLYDRLYNHAQQVWAAHPIVKSTNNSEI